MKILNNTWSFDRDNNTITGVGIFRDTYNLCDLYAMINGVHPDEPLGDFGDKLFEVLLYLIDNNLWSPKEIN